MFKTAAMSSVFSPTTTIVRTPDQVSGDIDGKVVLLSIANGEYYNMNEVGSRVWALLENPMTVGSLIEQLMNEFEVDRTTCEAEVVAFLDQLQKDNLLQITPGQT